MCDKNINEILDLNFASSNDQFNWINSTDNVIETQDDQLVLKPDSNESVFIRNLGNLSPENNRINLKVNFDLFRPQLSQHDSFSAKFEIYNGSSLIDVYTFFVDEIESGQVSENNFERIYKYSNLTGAISLKITVTEGWENVLKIDYIKCFDFNYCDDDVRNYFILDSFFESALDSTSSAIQLLEYKIDNVETLTNEFFNENNSPGGNPLTDWFFAKSNIDGTNRVAETTDPNTFNPFVSEFGLEFDVSNYYGGKPTGVVSGSDYGEGILNIGFEKPSILNGELISHDGVFFVDIDYTKNLKIVFNVIVNDNNSNVFNSPNIFREYTITWNAEKCSGSFVYKDILNDNEIVDQFDNGFLFGLTNHQSTSIESIECDKDLAFNGEEGTFSFNINFGNETGQCGISYEAFSQPDKFEIEWNGQVFSSGFVGSSAFDQQLINLGYNLSEINTGTPSTGNGTLLFNKDQATPNTALIRVTAPFDRTAWNISGICPSGEAENQPPIVSIESQSNVFGQGNEQVFLIQASDADGTIESWSIQWGNEGTTTGTGHPPQNLNKTFSTIGNKTIVINVVDNDGLVGSGSYDVTVTGGNTYQISGSTFMSCNSVGMSGTLTVESGQVTAMNEFTDVQGNPISGTITIDGQELQEGESIVLTVGVYPYTSTGLNCSNGTGYNELIIFS